MKTENDITEAAGLDFAVHNDYIYIYIYMCVCVCVCVIGI